MEIFRPDSSSRKPVATVSSTVEDNVDLSDHVTTSSPPQKQPHIAEIDRILEMAQKVSLSATCSNRTATRPASSIKLAKQVYKPSKPPHKTRKDVEKSSRVKKAGASVKPKAPNQDSLATPTSGDTAPVDLSHNGDKPSDSFTLKSGG